ncbi:hypothetical protein NOCA2640012 [metagenome]|uniref:Methyltransferase domain-containing protein n=1 Tax=metagenome TaxID=256318 RepID=A0A2P2CCA1_9ZZZZ
MGILNRHRPTPRQPLTAPAPIGLVEEFSQRLIVGWVSVPPGSPPTRVVLRLGDLQVSATYATPGPSMSGSGSVLRNPVPGQPAPQSRLAHPWQVPMIAGPADDRRNSPDEIRTFSFRVRGIWEYARPSTPVSVSTGGVRLPIMGHGMFLRPPHRGRRTVAELRRRFEAGYLLTQNGRIALSKQLDHEWQRAVMSLYTRVRERLSEAYGYDVFFLYGTLLGAVREGGYIGHDIDFDAGYVSDHRTGPLAAAELRDIALLLIRDGLDVDCRLTALHIVDPDHPGHRIDLFHTWFDDDGVLRFPFGVAGTRQVYETEWSGTREIEFPGGRGLVPVAAEALVAQLYGEDWRQPKPGFNWNLDRTESAPEGRLTTAMRTMAYWANFYARNSYASGSTFFEFVNARADTPATIIDIGCGDGRDSCAFAVAGRQVLGLDQSPVGIENAAAHAHRLEVADHCRFLVCDVADIDDLRRALDQGVERGEEPLMFYLRFFLHAIDDEVQDGLLAAIDTHARAGDYFAAEFRTDKDEQNSHVHTRHYRRFQNAAEFSARLTGELRFEILHEEERTGLSPYRDEDPVLYRVIARR